MKMTNAYFLNFERLLLSRVQSSLSFVLTYDLIQP